MSQPRPSAKREVHDEVRNIIKPKAEEKGTSGPRTELISASSLLSGVHFILQLYRPRPAQASSEPFSLSFARRMLIKSRILNFFFLWFSNLSPLPCFPRSSSVFLFVGPACVCLFFHYASSPYARGHPCHSCFYPFSLRSFLSPLRA